MNKGAPQHGGDKTMSDDKKTLERLRAELDDWRGNLDQLRLKANLGRMEARDKLVDLEQRLGPGFREAKRRLDTIVASGTEEARTLGNSLLAGWDELRRTHRELSRQAELERAKAHKGNRS